MKKIIFVVIVLSLLTVCCLKAHDPDGNYGYTIGIKTILNENSKYNDNKKKYLEGFGLEFNVLYHLLNCGLSQNFRIDHNPKTSLYLGIGLVNILQIQYGYNTIGSSLLRFKTEIPIFNDGFLLQFARKSILTRICLLINYEIDLNSSNNNNLNIGLSIFI